MLFIDASAEFARSRQQEQAQPPHQQKILDAFTAREDIEHFARLVDNGDIAANGYNIAVSSYVEPDDTVTRWTSERSMRRSLEIVARQQELRAADRCHRRGPGGERVSRVR